MLNQVKSLILATPFVQKYAVFLWVHFSNVIIALYHRLDPNMHSFANLSCYLSIISYGITVILVLLIELCNSV